jgi:Mg/Co/Ni transporter MgtE
MAFSDIAVPWFKRGGNSGCQASALVIRALAPGERTRRDLWPVVRREVFSGLASGVYRPHMKVISYLGTLDRIRAIAVTTRNGNTIAPVATVLGTQRTDTTRS